MSQDEQPSEAMVYQALSEVIDPEIGLDIVTLGMIYGVDVNESTVDVVFTLTTPGCPMEEIIRGGILSSVRRVPGVKDVNANLVWEPRWHPGLVAEGVL